MVPPQHEEILGIFNFVRQEETDGFQRLLAAIDVIAEEDVVGFGGEPSIFEQTEEVVVLAVDVAANLDGGLEFEEHGLGDEEVAGAKAEHFYFGFGEVDLLSWAGTADGKEFVDDDIYGIREEGNAGHASGGLATGCGGIVGGGSSCGVSVGCHDEMMLWGLIECGGMGMWAIQ